MRVVKRNFGIHAEIDTFPEITNERSRRCLVTRKHVRTDKRRAAPTRGREARNGIARCESLHNDLRLINFYYMFTFELPADGRRKTYKRLCIFINFIPASFIVSIYSRGNNLYEDEDYAT